MHKSTRARNSVFDIITGGTPKIGILPTLHAKGNTTKTARQQKQQQTHQPHKAAIGPTHNGPTLRLTIDAWRKIVLLRHHYYGSG